MKLGNILILGDSYSTFEGYNPEGFEVYYTAASDNTGVRDVRDTWWHMLISETDAQLLRNDSWSGSPICFTGYDAEDCSETSSFLFRLETLTEQGFFQKNQVDTVFVFGGTNDCWADAPLGKPQYHSWKKQELYSVLPAICCLFKRLQDVVPNAARYCIINTELKPELVSEMTAACRAFGATAVILSQIEKIDGHPTQKGMHQIKEQILRIIKQTCG